MPIPRFDASKPLVFFGVLGEVCLEKNARDGILRPRRFARGSTSGARKTRLTGVNQPPKNSPWIARRFLVLFFGASLIVSLGGCGLLPISSGDGASKIAFSTGVLRSNEETSFAAVDAACTVALDRLGYGDLEVERETDRTRFRARTAGGEPVDVRVFERGPSLTELRIRIGLFGNETTSRLVLEQIHQSL